MNAFNKLFDLLMAHPDWVCTSSTSAALVLEEPVISEEMVGKYTGKVVSLSRQSPASGKITLTAQLGKCYMDSSMASRYNPPRPAIFWNEYVGPKENRIRLEWSTDGCMEESVKIRQLWERASQNRAERRGGAALAALF